MEVYYSIGNIISIWPGGNENRGKFGCYDLPEFYFSKDKIKPWFDFLDYKYDINLKTYIDKKNRGGLNFGEGISKFLDDIDVKKYQSYLSQITKIIKKRNEYLTRMKCRDSYHITGSCYIFLPYYTKTQQS